MASGFGEKIVNPDAVDDNTSFPVQFLVSADQGWRFH
jgi:hypothetical protein